MAETAEDILELLEQRQLVSEKMVAKLRKKVDSASSPVSARKLAKVLLDKGLITPSQAKELLKAKVERKDRDQPANPADDELSQPENRDRAAPAGDELDLEDIEEVQTDPASRALAAAAAEPLDDDVLMMDGYEYQMEQDKLDGFDNDPLSPGLDAPRSRTSRRITRVTKRWDSKLILGGSGALILLAVSGVFLFYVLSRGTADEQFTLAMTSYNNGNYMQAISDFEKYLEKFSKDIRVSEARVRIGLAKMWQEADVSKNWQQALDTSNEVLPTIESEESFGPTARPDLAGLFVTVADGFAEQARTSSGDEAERFVDLFGQTMVLIDNSNYVPTTQRKSVQNRLDDVEARIRTVQRSINRDRQLATTVENIRQASTAGDIGAAYDARDELLKVYPALEDHLELQTAIREITGRQLELVKVSEEPLTALTTDEKETRQVALPSQTGLQAKGVDGHILYYLAEGAVYGIDAKSGKALWRRYVGHESEIHPVPLGLQPGSDVLYIDGRRHELVRRAATDGKLVWRLPVAEPLLESIAVSDRLIAATQSGRILLVDQEQGSCYRQVQLPQPINVRPGVDEKRGRIYVAADHSNLYVLDAETLNCDEVHYIGHTSGAVSGPAVAAMGIVFVPERLSPKFSQLHVLGTDRNGLELRRVQDPLRLDGHIVQPPIVMGRQLLVVTNLGVVYLFEIDKKADTNPVSQLTKTVKTTEQPMVPQTVVAEGQLWVGDERLTSYQLQTARGSIVRRSVTHSGDAFVGPIRAIGKVLFHMRQRADQPGMTVTANYIGGKSRADAAADSIWEIKLGVPAAGEPLSRGDSAVTIVSAHGELFELGPDEIRRGMDDQSEEAIQSSRTPFFNQGHTLRDGKIMFISRHHLEQVALLDPDGNGQRLRIVELNVPPGSLSTPPVALGEDVLCLTRHGQVLLLELPGGKSKVDPFQPALRPGQRLNWQRPAVVGGDAQPAAVVYDGHSKLYRIAATTGPRPQLIAQIERELEVSLDGGLASAGDTVFGVVRAAAADKVISFAVADLAPGKNWDVSGHVIWGPVRAGELVLAATDSQKLYCFESGQQLRWTADMAYGPIVGAPLVRDESLTLSSLHGTIWRVAADSGQELGQVQVGEPLGTGPVQWNAETLLLAGHDGTMYAVAPP